MSTYNVRKWEQSVSWNKWGTILCKLVDNDLSNLKTKTPYVYTVSKYVDHTPYDSNVIKTHSYDFSNLVLIITESTAPISISCHDERLISKSVDNKISPIAKLFSDKIKDLVGENMVGERDVKWNFKILNDTIPYFKTNLNFVHKGITKYFTISFTDKVVS